MTVSLIDVSTYLPGEPIGADYYAQFAESDDLRDNLMFRAPKFRHHVAEDETAIDMVERATQGLVARHGHDAITNVDVLITHTQMPDMPFYGGGGGMAHRLGMRPSACSTCTTAAARPSCWPCRWPSNCCPRVN